jgi:tetratricopeptide (TPR) repeat protein
MCKRHRALPVVSVLSLALAFQVLASEETERLLRGTSAVDALRAAEIYEARVATAPQSFEARLGAATAFNQAMAIRTNGNLPLIDGLQDTDANRALWADWGERALDHARAAHALRPGSVEAASQLATAYMFYASSLGIVRSILQGAAGEYRAHARRLIELDAGHDDALGDTLLASVSMVAPWPVGDRDAALEHYERAAELAPDSVRCQYGLGVYWAREGDEKRAHSYFSRVVERPCSEHSERLFCDFMKRTARSALLDLGRE